jgi:hypothetical protein
MTWTKEQQAENRAKWVTALRSGEYKQGRQMLRSDADEYCCLGVACELAAAENVVPEARRVNAAEWDYEYGGDGQLLPDAVVEWLGLRDRYGAIIDGFRPYGEPNALTEVNDAGEDFDGIADLIESGAVELVDPEREP